MLSRPALGSTHRGEENVDLYIPSPIRLHGVLLNYLSTGTTLPLRDAKRRVQCVMNSDVPSPLITLVCWLPAHFSRAESLLRTLATTLSLFSVLLSASQGGLVCGGCFPRRNSSVCTVIEGKQFPLNELYCFIYTRGGGLCSFNQTAYSLWSKTENTV
jgi:hypothetical protein